MLRGGGEMRILVSGKKTRQACGWRGFKLSTYRQRKGPALGQLFDVKTVKRTGKAMGVKWG